MIVRIYGELYDVELSFFDNIEILEAKDYTNTVFIDYTKGEYKDKKITLSMDKEDYLLLIRHLKIKSLGI